MYGADRGMRYDGGWTPSRRWWFAAHPGAPLASPRAQAPRTRLATALDRRTDPTDATAANAATRLAIATAPRPLPETRPRWRHDRVDGVDARDRRVPSRHRARRARVAGER